MIRCRRNIKDSSQDVEAEGKASRVQVREQGRELFVFKFSFSKTGFSCVALAVLEVTM